MQGRHGMHGHAAGQPQLKPQEKPQLKLKLQQQFGPTPLAASAVINTILYICAHLQRMKHPGQGQHCLFG
jgi:hypothetical protein